MSRIAYCAACSAIESGVRTRIPLEHTCGLHPSEWPVAQPRKTFNERLAEEKAKRDLFKEKWIKATATWNSYPNGTKAKATMGGYWIKTDHGWYWPGGSTFPTPGGDATGEVCLPEVETMPNDTQLPADSVKCIADQMQRVVTYASNVALFMSELIRKAVNSAESSYISDSLKAAVYHFEQLKAVMNHAASESLQLSETTVFVPCEEGDPRCSGGYTSNCGRSLCFVRETTVPVIEQGAVWVKAKRGMNDGIYCMKCCCSISGNIMLGVGLVANGEIVLITYLNKSSYGKDDLPEDYKGIFFLDESAGEKEDRKGLEWLHNPIIEFCYRHADGRVEVKYRRVEGTPECNELKSEVEKLIESAKPDESPYFYRKEGEKEVKP